jgi:hypothetical protein
MVRLARASFAALSLVALVACGGRSSAPAARPIAAYSGRAAELFDDTIEPAAVGLDFDRGYSPRSDPLLRERAQTADASVRVRVATVTAKKNGPEETYQLGLHTVEVLTGKNAPPVDFTVTISKTSESHGIVKNFEARLIGYSFVAFVREFAMPSGDRELHFHLAPDTKDVKKAVDDAMVIGGLK